jgi:glycosyltransferase involved in cell wall biosynthesis
VVIYPPVDVSYFECEDNKENYYLTASRMVPYKSMPLIIEAFSKMPDKKLIVIGDGPELTKCQALAGSNVEILGWQSNDVLKRYMQKARAFVFAAEEDFGIVPLEAQACGTPVIAYARGGALETIRADNTPSKTGIFFYEKNVEAICNAIRTFENDAPISSHACRLNAQRFSLERFQHDFKVMVEKSFEAHRARISSPSQF